MIQAVPTNKFSTFTTVPKNSSINSFNNESRSNELKVAENRMAKIEERLLAVESTTNKRNIYYFKQFQQNKFNKTQLYIEKSDSTTIAEDAVRNYQKQLLVKLLSVREKVSEEVGDYAKIKEERDSLLTENVKLKKEAERQNYRIQHLVKALIAEEEKHNLSQLQD